MTLNDSNMKRLMTILVAVAIAALMGACDSKAFFDESRAVDEHGWAVADSVAFDVSVADTTSSSSKCMRARAASS